MKRSLGQQFLLVAVVATLFAATVAHAEDTAPGWRGAPGTAHAKWGFGENDTHPAPDAKANPSTTEPDPTLEISGTAVYVPTTVTGPFGVWKLTDTTPAAPAGQMVAKIPNVRDPQGIKEMRIQITYLGTLGQPQLTVPNVFVAGAATKSSVNDVWVHWTTTWVAYGCPQNETITIAAPAHGTTIIDDFVVDTICRHQGPF